MNTSLLALLALAAIVCISDARLDYDQVRTAYGNGFQPQFSAEIVPMTAGQDGKVYTETRFGKILEKRPQAPWTLRNCYLSPVQCLLPVEQHKFNKFHKRFMF